VIENWRKATYSANNAACVETGWVADLVGYRDTKQAGLSTQPELLFPQDAAREFLTVIRSRT
jgi:hypothetical protein